MQRFLILFLVLTGCIAQDKTSSYSVKHYNPSSEMIRITGRVERADSVTMFWPGTSIKMRFRGTDLKVHLRDERGENYFNVVIDGDSVSYIKLDSAKRYYSIASGLSDGDHTVELVKRNEWDKGRTWFYGVQVTKGELLSPPDASGRIIEFFGDSITAGYAIDDTSGKDSPEGPNTNNYYTYAARTARHFNADLYCTVRSGIGVMISWGPLIMPELYDRLNPNDSTSKWDFKSVTPQVVVINLMQNDSWLVNMPDHESFKRIFGKIPPSGSQIIASYKSFVQKIRNAYPDAHIICALGSMDATKKGSPWPSYVNSAVDQMQDEKIHTIFFPYTNKNGHPLREDNEKMAAQLIDFIEKNTEW